MMMKLLFSCLVLALAFTTANVIAFAQKETATGVDPVTDVNLLRRDLRAEKKQLIALNVPLTEAEATKFWPVYDQFVADITKPYDDFYGAVKEFAAKQKTISDAESSALMKRWSDGLIQIAQTRQRYIPIFEKVIPPKKVATFMQVDRRLYALIDLQVVSQTPLLGQ
jgi:hypothetical protein